MPNPVVRLELLVSSGKGERGRVTGSGFVVSEDGYLVTNDHVVHPAVGGHAWNVNSLLVKLDPDGPKERALRGKVVAFDSAADVAVVKIDPPKQLPVLRIVGSPEPKAGDRVIARGYPLGGKFTVTKGEVLRLHEPTGKCPTKIVVCNARVEQGNSGGPLVNQTGEVVGVAVAKAIIRIDRPDADRLRAMAEVQDAAAQALRQMSEAAAKAGMKLKAEGDKGGYGAQLSELASQGKKAVEEYEIRRPGILELAYGSAQFTFAIAIEDVRRLLQKWNVPVKE
jgi:S1-C subfamily serine protease